MSAAGAAKPPIRFGPDGLIPAVIQDAASDRVLMVGFMNEEALAATRATGRVHFWSRSRQKLWRKGETSGHEQIVDEMFTNCDQNSLLVVVRQVGAVCHDGYDTCFYRRLEPDNELTVTRERVFDPDDVYGRAGTGDDLATLSRTHYDAFAYLRDHDLSAESRTSALLHDPAANVRPRIADELRELAGVLDGSHRHRDFPADVLLEGSQVLYWVTLAALHDRLDWHDLRPDRALATTAAGLAPATLARLLLAAAAGWEAPVAAAEASYHETLALTGQAAHLAGITALALVSSDLDAIKTKPYMRQYFDQAGEHQQV